MAETNLQTKVKKEEPRAQTSSTSQPFLLINPDAFTTSKESQENKEQVGVNSNGTIVESNGVYDRMSRVNPDQVNPKYLGTIDLDTLNPILKKSLDRNSDIRNESVLSHQGSHIPQGITEHDKLSQNVRNILDTATLSMQNQQLAELLKELKKGQDSLKKDLLLRTEKLEGTKKNLYTHQHQFDDIDAKRDALVSEGVKIGYSGLHAIGNTIRNISFLPRYKIFTAPPTSITEQNNKIIEELSKEIEIHQSALTKGNIELQKIELQLKSIQANQEKFASETDPQQSIELINKIKTSAQSVVSALGNTVSLEDPKLKQELDISRKKIKEGFEHLDRQFGLAEAALHATEKGVVVAGAIGGASLTGGASLGILAGTGVGAVGSIAESGGHFLMSAAIDTPEQFNVEQELSKFGSDVKDAALYATGQRLSMALLGKSSQIATSTGKIKGANPVGSAGNGLRNLDQTAKPLNYLRPKTYFDAMAGMSQAASSASQVATTSLRTTFGGLSSGIVVETPAALFDTGYSYMTDRNALDPDGRLRAMGVSNESLFLRALTIRLSTAGAGGVFGFGASKFRGTQTTMTRSLVGGVAELGGDLAVNVNTEAVLRGWLYGANGRLKEEDIEQLLVSGVAGHAAGRMQHHGVAKIEQKRKTQANAYADNLNSDVTSRTEELGLSNNSNAAVVLGSKYNVEVEIPQGTVDAKSHTGVHLGDKDHLAMKRFSQQEHRAVGNAVSHTLSKVDSSLKETVDGGLKAIDIELVQGANYYGAQPILQKDRETVQSTLKQSVSDRAYGLSLLGSHEVSTQANQLKNHADNLNDHVNRYLNEREGSNVAHSRTPWFSNFIDNIINPYGATKSKVLFSSQDQSLHPQTPLTSLSSWLSNQVDATPIVGHAYRGIKNVSSKIWNTELIQNLSSLTWNASTTSALGLYTATTTSLYGSIGMLGGSLYAGSLILGKGASSIATGLNVGYRLTGLDSIIYSRGSADAVGNLIGKISEGKVLLEKMNEIKSKDTTLIEQYKIKQLETEIKTNEKLLEKANNRLGGILGSFIRNTSILPELFLPKISKKERDLHSDLSQIDGLKKGENRNRMLSEESVKKSLEISEKLFREMFQFDIKDVVDSSYTSFKSRLRSAQDTDSVIQLKEKYASDKSVLTDTKKLDALHAIRTNLESQLANAQGKDAARIQSTLDYLDRGTFRERIESLTKKEVRRLSDELTKEILSTIDLFIDQPHIIDRFVVGALYPDVLLANRYKQKVRNEIIDKTELRLESLTQLIKNETNAETKLDLEKKLKEYESLKKKIEEIKEDTKFNQDTHVSLDKDMRRALSDRIRRDGQETIEAYLDGYVAGDNSNNTALFFALLNKRADDLQKYKYKLSRNDFIELQNDIKLIIASQDAVFKIKNNADEYKSFREEISNVFRGADEAAKRNLARELSVYLADKVGMPEHLENKAQLVRRTLLEDVSSSVSDYSIKELLVGWDSSSFDKKIETRDKIKAHIKAKKIVEVLSENDLPLEKHESSIYDVREKAGQEFAHIVSLEIQNLINKPNFPQNLADDPTGIILKELYPHNYLEVIGKFRTEFASFEQTKIEFADKVSDYLTQDTSRMDIDTFTKFDHVKNCMAKVLELKIVKAIEIAKKKDKVNRNREKKDITVHESLAFDDIRDLPLLRSLKNQAQIERALGDSNTLSSLQVSSLRLRHLVTPEQRQSLIEDVNKKWGSIFDNVFGLPPAFSLPENLSALKIEEAQSYLRSLNSHFGSVYAHAEAHKILKSIDKKINELKKENEKKNKEEIEKLNERLRELHRVMYSEL